MTRRNVPSTRRLHLVDGREYEVKANRGQFVGLFDRERLAFVQGRVALTVDEVEHVRARPTAYDKRDPLHWFDVDRCFLAPREAVLPWAHPYAAVARSRRRTPDGDAVRTKSAEHALAFVAANPACKVQQCAEAIGLHRYTAQRLLNQLKADGVVVRHRVRNSTNAFGIIDLWYEVSAAPQSIAASDPLP